MEPNETVLMNSLLVEVPLDAQYVTMFDNVVAVTVLLVADIFPAASLAFTLNE